MKKRLLTAAAAGLLSTGMMMNAFVAPDVSEGGAIPYSDGTEVYAGVIMNDPDAKIKVYVPTLFAFVVNGSVDEGAEDAISVENGNLLLPNLKVEVDTEDGNPEDHDYSIQTVGEGHMYFENCSTAWDEDEPTARVGVPVEIRGSIKNEGTLESRNYWEHIGTEPTTADFKKYRLNVDGIEFSNSEAGGKQNDDRPWGSRLLLAGLTGCQKSGSYAEVSADIADTFPIEAKAAGENPQLIGSDGPYAVLHTTAGDITVLLYEKEAPKAVENFVQLAKQGYYDGSRFFYVKKTSWPRQESLRRKKGRSPRQENRWLTERNGASGTDLLKMNFTTGSTIFPERWEWQETEGTRTSASFILP